MSETGQQIIAEIRRVAAENPNGTVPRSGCVYVGNDGNPSCLVGHALVNLDIIDPEAAARRGWNHRQFALIYNDAFNLDLDEDEVRWIADAQDAQDLQRSWSEAVACADVEREWERNDSMEEDEQ